MGGISWCSYDMLYIQRLCVCESGRCVRCFEFFLERQQEMQEAYKRREQMYMHSYTFDTHKHFHLSMVWPLPMAANSRIVPNCRQMCYVCQKCVSAHARLFAYHVGNTRPETCSYKCIFTFAVMVILATKELSPSHSLSHPHSSVTNHFLPPSPLLPPPSHPLTIYYPLLTIDLRQF
jgi:hypothetical protein